MAFKMAGFSAFTKKEEKVTRRKSNIENLPLQEGEDTAVETYTGDVYEEKIADIEDRIEFIENDIADEQGGKMTPSQRATLAKLDQKRRELRKNKPV
tara:strand:+ start:238 stop:528 length:291 start_codon:yes stop_codon:yes gene_type:complete